MYVLHFPNMGGFQSKCACGEFESDPQPTRPEAIREHTVHIASIGVYA
ncbi:hypothetical protein [Agrococcus sp. DT81.2]